MPVCSLQRIEITNEDGDYSSDAPEDNQDYVLCDFGDQLETEVEVTPSVGSQDTTAIDAQAVVVRGRGGKMQSLEWSRTLTHESADAARQYLITHIGGLPSRTIGAQLTYESDEDDVTGHPNSERPDIGYKLPGGASQSNRGSFQTYRAQLSAYPGSPASGLDTTITYTLRWQLGTVDGGGAPPPADDYRLLTNSGGGVFSSRGPQILIFH